MKEDSHIREALAVCGYPKWTVDKIKKQMKDKKAKLLEKKSKPDQENKNKGMVVIPYVAGLSEKVSRVLKKHCIATAMKPHTTIRNNLVHPKDKTR
jgi:hypothetical protein